MWRNIPHYKHRHGELRQTEVQEHPEPSHTRPLMNSEQLAIVLDPQWSPRRTYKEGPKKAKVKSLEHKKKTKKRCTSSNSRPLLSYNVLSTHLDITSKDNVGRENTHIIRPISPT
jgi:hypothetical protein